MYNINDNFNTEADMNFHRFLALLLALVMALSIISCKKEDSHGDYHPSPNDQQQSNNDTQSGGEGTVTFVYSVVSKTLHMKGCYHIDRMNEEYIFEHTGSITPLLEKGYTICKDCLVPDDEKDDEPEKEDDYAVSVDQATYAYNKASRVIHELDCHNLKIMNEENLRYTNLSIDELIELFHVPCGSCLPDEYEQYKKDHPEEDK